MYLKEKIKSNEAKYDQEIADKDAVIQILEKEKDELLNYKEANEIQIVAYELKLQERDNMYNNSNDKPV